MITPEIRTDTTVYRYTTDGTSCNSLQLVTVTGIYSGTTGLSSQKETSDGIQCS